MPKYVVDTNLYIEAGRSDEGAKALRGFYARFLPFLYLHSVVAQELLAGAVSASLERETKRHYLAPFESVRRVITPTHTSWKRAGEIIARLTRAKRIRPGAFKRSFVNDCLIAASAEEAGFRIVSRNVEDFTLIRSVARVEVLPPWPSAR